MQGRGTRSGGAQVTFWQVVFIVLGVEVVSGALALVFGVVAGPKLVQWYMARKFRKMMGDVLPSPERAEDDREVTK